MTCLAITGQGGTCGASRSCFRASVFCAAHHKEYKLLVKRYKEVRQKCRRSSDRLVQDSRDLRECDYAELERYQALIYDNWQLHGEAYQLRMLRSKRFAAAFDEFADESAESLLGMQRRSFMLLQKCCKQRIHLKRMSTDSISSAYFGFSPNPKFARSIEVDNSVESYLAAYRLQLLRLINSFLENLQLGRHTKSIRTAVLRQIVLRNAVFSEMPYSSLDDLLQSMTYLHLEELWERCLRLHPSALRDALLSLEQTQTLSLQGWVFMNLILGDRMTVPDLWYLSANLEEFLMIARYIAFRPTFFSTLQPIHTAQNKLFQCMNLLGLYVLKSDEHGFDAVTTSELFNSTLPTDISLRHRRPFPVNYVRIDASPCYHNVFQQLTPDVCLSLDRVYAEMVAAETMTVETRLDPIDRSIIEELKLAYLHS